MVSCAGAERKASSDLMNVRRLIAALVAISFVLALAFPPGPAEAALSFADMPCHAETAQATGGDEASQTDPSCCLPLCWLAMEPASSVPGECLAPILVGGASTPFASVSDRPRARPPKRA
jgi:hypothetical protein